VIRPVSLARVAVEAEGVRLRAMAMRIVRHAVYAAIALVFLLGALVFAHVAAWYGIRTGLELTPIATAGVLGGIDLLIAIILGLLARRTTPSRLEREALQVRREAVANLRSAVNVTQVALPLLRYGVPLMRRRRRRRV
jgi:Na+/H+ antiporter NhaA